jgi:hypothetical protein
VTAAHFRLKGAFWQRTLPLILNKKKLTKLERIV